MEIREVLKNSPAQRCGLRKGDVLLSINGEPIRDEIDLKFHSSEENIRIKVKREGRILSKELHKNPDRDLGLRIAEAHFRRCRNKCLFCFVDQMPRGLRPSLYIKDEDFRLSFLYGNYLTMTNITSGDIQRICQQRLSPLYVSVHATDERVRRHLLGRKDIPPIMPIIDDLVTRGITLHTQVVICPGINDGRVLDKTVSDLASLYPGVASIALVPVGLTKYREGLPKLAPVSKKLARHLIAKYRAKQIIFRKKFNKTILYFSDELYLLSGLDIPDNIWYDDYPQIENGVGMVSVFRQQLEKFSLSLPYKISNCKRIALLTGFLAKPILEPLKAILNKIKGMESEILPVPNQLFGASVTVSGLLAANDILSVIKKSPRYDLVALPDNLLNGDGLFIDDVKRSDFERMIKPAKATFGLNELALAIQRCRG